MRVAQPRPSRYEFSKVTANFTNGGDECAGWLYRPDRPAEPPVVVMAAGFGSRRSFGLPAIAERFAARGYAVYLFDYRNFGDSEGEPRHLVVPGRQLSDWQAAVERVRTLPNLDHGRVALWGTSLSGGHVINVAAEDPRIAAVVAQTPYVDGRAVARNKGLGFLAKSLGAGLKDRLLSVAGRTSTVPVVGDPSEFAVLNEPGSKSGFFDLVPPRSDWQNETPARTFLSMPRYRPVKNAGDVSCPTLLLAGERDNIVPPSSVERAADKLSDATLVRMPVGHFDVFDGDAFEEAFGHELAFLDARLR
jgi:pimeloyl-ACP methyl ester carboxylesterase